MFKGSAAWQLLADSHHLGGGELFPPFFPPRGNLSDPIGRLQAARARSQQIYVSLRARGGHGKGRRGHLCRATPGRARVATTH